MIVAFLLVVSLLSLGMNVLCGSLLVKASRKLIQFDDLVNYLVDDMETNIDYFDKLSSTPTLSNAPEIQAANKNMTIMSARLDEYLNRFEELTGSQIRKKTNPKLPTSVDV
jgi:hypothetical protein